MSVAEGPLSEGGLEGLEVIRKALLSLSCRGLVFALVGRGASGSVAVWIRAESIIVLPMPTDDQRYVQFQARQIGQDVRTFCIRLKQVERCKLECWLKHIKE